MKFLIVFICFWEIAVINGKTVFRFGPEYRFMCHCKNVNEPCNKQTGNCPSGCARAWFGPGCQYRDLAHLAGSIVKQTYTNEREAQHTIDGDQNSCSSPSKHSDPWWKVWLPQNETITELYIISKDRLLKHFINTSVFIEYVPERHKHDKTYESQLSQLCYNDANVPPDKASFVIRCDKPFAGNQVRIQLEGKRKLVLCDVKINGGRNLAFGQLTTQSATVQNSDTFASDRAVDGDIATCSWTNGVDKSAWWNFFFGYTAIIQHITVTTKTEYRTGLKGRLFNANNEIAHNWEDDGNSQHAVHEEANAIEITPKTGATLIICETELYGDCAENLCGLDCKTECHCKSMTIWTRISANCSTAEMDGDEERYVTSAKDSGQEVVCDDGSYSKPCTKCGYCLNNKSCDRTTDMCPNGCQSGYTGVLCDMECPHGKYGNQCSMTCTNTCGDNCNHVNGSCGGNCKDGWKGDKCDEIECANKKYGQGCAKTCSTNCKYGTCNHVNGNCDGGCKDGWKGDKCEDGCSINKYGQGCKQRCSADCRHGTCNRVSGKCDGGCKDGWQGDKCVVGCSINKYGQGCKQRCSANCRNGTCNRVSGKCDGGCKDGWQGDKCVVGCSHNKYGAGCTNTCSTNCKDGTCNHVSGTCLGGCKDGWKWKKCVDECSHNTYGPRCAKKCSTNCKHGTCYHVSGICNEGCKDGWQGDKCINACHPGRYGRTCAYECSEHCTRGQQKCRYDNGHCYSGCKPGWMPPLCTEECSSTTYGQRCSGRCNVNCKRGTCNNVDGTCDGGCKDGWQGDKCSSKCDSGKYGDQCGTTCSRNCRGSYGCNNVNGSCVYGCKYGWQGEKCEDDGKCKHINGKCENGCTAGWQGEFCKSECSSTTYGQRCSGRCNVNCKRGTCNHIDGKCDGGCKDGWQRDKCSSKCDSGKYGDECGTTCSKNCKGSNRCNHVNGSCVYGCKKGWQGEKCEDACEAGKYGNDCQYQCNGNCRGGNGFCNHTDGSCQDGCEAGWTGKQCTENCAAGMYGDMCAHRCNTNCNEGRCNHIDGNCEQGCKVGWHGDTCEDVCENGKWGVKCNNLCGNCFDGTCDHVDGHCRGNCSIGFEFTPLCDKECDDGFYGSNCSENCGSCNNGTDCDKVTGVCPNGCSSRYSGDLCNAECSSTTYGQRCSGRCNVNCKRGTCNHIDGKCDGGCKDGWQRDKCSSKCDSGKYGDECGTTCSKNCKGSNRCNHVNGSCVYGCKKGWQGEKCEDACEAGKYGNDCQYQCNGNCRGGNGFCNHTDGSCQDGCEAGWTGKQCTENCAAGMYGDMCAHRCNTNCNEGRCNHIDGNCEQGCKVGWHGDTCEDVCENGKWGVKCNNLCGNCFDGTCDHVDGHCRGNCSIGFEFTPLCDKECDDGFYGSNCSENCGSCNNGTDCDKVTGVCPNGCSSRYSGDLCNAVVAKQASAGMTIPVGIGAGVFLLLVIVLIVLFVKLGKRKRRVPTDDDIELHHENVNNDSKAGPSGTHAPCPRKEDKVVDGRSKSRVQVSRLLQYVKQNLSSKEKLISEFQTIPYGLKYASEAACLPVNIAKNRYREIYPYDHSRVILSAIQGKPNSEYVNASYVQGRFRENAYIAAQGPIKESLDDFWRMIWEKDIRTIAMLTKLVEEMKVKCIQYWGSQNSETMYGNLTVCNVSEHIFAEYTIRRFKVFYKKDREHDRTLTQFHYTAWPDKGVPRSTSSLVQFWNVVRQADSLKSHTWLVHCSAGVGRTGTFIAMDLLYDEGDDLGTVDIHHCVQTLREQRLNMVQTKEQYKFLHGLAVEMLVLPSKQIHLDAYSALYASLQTVDSQLGKSSLLLQYEGLQDEISFMNLIYESCKLPNAADNDDRFAAAKLDANKSKNRYQNVLPANEFRPFLASNVPGCTNYINAVYVQSYCNLRGYILTQTPMKETAIDCCRLLIEEEVKVIVTFNLKGKGKEDVGEYLPENGTIELGPFTCTKIAETDESNYVLRKHKIVYKTESHETIVYQLMFKNWPTKGVIPSDSHSILDFLQAVEFYNRREAGKAIVVQCLNGAERSGLFVVLMNIMEHLRYESRVSIPHLIRCARVRREQIIPNFEQYKFCHDTLLSYVESNTTYANM